MIMQLNNLFYLILFILGSITFISNRKHLLMTLISLEFMIICLYLYLYVSLNSMEYMYYFSMIFLTLSVCESSLGLSILVSLVRSHGSDYFQTYSILQC